MQGEVPFHIKEISKLSISLKKGDMDRVDDEDIVETWAKHNFDHINSAYQIQQEPGPEIMCFERVKSG